MKLLFAALFASVPLSLGPSRCPTDVIELNTVLDPKTLEPRFSQVLLWERLPDTGKLIIREWYMLTDFNAEIGKPYKTTGGQWEVVLPNRRAKVKVYSDLYRETRTLTDPERENQKVLNVKFRLSFPKRE